MKILLTAQKNFEILGICSNQSRINKKYVVTCLSYGLGTISSTVFLFSEADSFQEYTNNLYITTALPVGLFCFMNINFKMNELFTLIKNIEDILEIKLKSRISKAIYRHTNRFVEKLSRIVHLVIAIITPIGTIFPKAIVSFSTYFATDSGNEAFELPLFYWFPFNWRNPIGYFVAVIFEYITYARHHILLSSAITIGVGNFFFVLSVIEDCENDLNAINESAKTQKNRLKTLKQISDFIQIHSTCKRYIDEFVDIYQPIFMIIYIWSLITICGVMLLVQMAIQGNHSMALVLTTTFFSFYAFGIVLVICEFGQRLADAFEELNDVIEDFDWNLFSLEIQKMLPLLLIIAQKPVVLRCFGSTAGLRETFKKVVNSALSYFMVIRQFLK